MRTPRRHENGLKKGSWTAEEDQKLIAYIKRYKIWNWSLMPKFAGLSRNGKSCRLRWVNYLNPGLKQGNISKEEEDTIVSMYTKLGSRWSAIAARLPGRTDNQIKNYWHTHLKKRFKQKQVPTNMITPEGIEIRNFEANVLNSGKSNITTAISSPEALNSEGSSNLAMTDPSVLVVESSSSSVGSSVGVFRNDQIDDASVDSLRLNRDLQSFWTQPYEAYDLEWYHEPLSPYGFYNNEYWFHGLTCYLTEIEMDGM